MNYSVFVTLWKMLTTYLITTCGIVVGVELTDLPADVNTFGQTWALYVLPVAFSALRGLENYRKNGPGGAVRWVWPWAKAWAWLTTPILICVLIGCASVGTKTSEAITNPDGTSYAFSYQGKSTAAPFGKVDATVHRMAYQTEDGANLTVGQDATGLDNTGQVAAISAMGEILGQTIAALLKGGIIAPATPEAVDTGGILGKLNTRLEELDSLIERLRAMGVIKEGAIIRPQPVLALPHN